MRTTRNAKTAARRLAEALGFTVESSGRRWNVVYDQAAPSYLRIDEGGDRLYWSGSYTAEGALGVMVDVAVKDAGFGLSYSEVWDLCRYTPTLDSDGDFWVRDEKWTGNTVLRMLREAREAGLEPLLETYGW